MTDGQLVGVLTFGPLICGCLLAAAVEARNIIRRNRLMRP